MISKKFINTLLGKIDVVEIVGKVVKLKKAGANHEGLCPFHEEKSPSFTVTRSKQFYHCFGCGAHGNAITFLMESQGMNFVSAVEQLSSQVGLTVEHEEDSEVRNDNSDVTSLLNLAASSYQEQLKKSPEAIDYLKGRGMKGETAKQFGVGYAPDGSFLKNVFSNYNDKALERAGLVRVNDKNVRRDWFYKRIMFPIMDTKGNVIGFGGRVLGSGDPKYINSPENPVFDKGRELFGLYQAQKALRAANEVLVVEGYMDVTGLYQSGIENAVASLGTSVTQHHLNRLLRQVDTITFCFDGDAAGDKAAWRTVDVALNCILDGKLVRFAFLENGDPDEFVLKHGKQAFLEIIAKSQTLTQMIIKRLSVANNLSTPEGRISFVHESRDFVQKLRKNAPGISALFKKEIAKTAEMSLDEVNEYYSRPVKTKNERQQQASWQDEQEALKGRRLLMAVVSNPSVAKKIDIAAIPADSFQKEVLDVITWSAANEATSALLIDNFRGTPAEELISTAQAEMLKIGDGFNEEAEIEAIFRELKRQAVTKEIGEITARIDIFGIANISADERAKFHQLVGELSLLM